MKKTVVTLCLVAFTTVSFAQADSSDYPSYSDPAAQENPCSVLQGLYDDTVSTLAQISQAKADLKTVEAKLDRAVNNTIGGAVLFTIPAVIMARSVIKYGSFRVNNIFDFFGWVIAADTATAGGIALAVYGSKIPALKSALKANEILKFRIVTEGESVPIGSELYKTGKNKEN